MDIVRRHVYQEEAGGGGGGAGGAAIAPAAAREFLTPFIPEAIKDMDDKAVVDHYGRFNTAIDKVRPPTAFPAQWRQELAKGADGKPVDAVVKRLERYTDPKKAIDALVSLQEKIGAGELRSAMPKDASPEAVAAWRTENGIPETPDKYEIKLPAGLVIGENDKPIIAAIFKEMHVAGLSNAMASKFVESYYKTQEQVQAAAAKQLTETKQAVDDQLHKDWGADYRPNKNLIDAVINEKIPAGSKLAERIKGALETDLEFARFMADVARTINPVTTLIPGSDSANISTGIDSEIAAIEKDMRLGRDNPASQYYKGPIEDRGGHKDTQMAHRYRDLLDARERAGGKK